MIEQIYNDYGTGKLTREEAIHQMVDVTVDKDPIELAIIMTDLFDVLMTLAIGAKNE